MTQPAKLNPLPQGNEVQIAGLTFTLSAICELASSAGFSREGRAADGGIHRILELPRAPLPASLEKAFQIPGAAQPLGRTEDDQRVLLALRRAPGPLLDWSIGRGEGLPLWDMTLVESLARLFQAVHQAGLCFRRVNPGFFAIAPDGSITLECPDELRLPSEEVALPANLYSAPEFGGSAEASERADQWALAALGWSLITGRTPFRRGEFWLPRIHRPQLPHGVWAVLQRALSPNPADRYPSCQAFAEDLRGRTVPKGSGPRKLSIAACSEIGRLKSQQMPVNQDAFFFGTDSASRRGMVLVADGVSTADVGSGDLASSMVREAVKSAWEGPVGEILRTHKGPLPEEWAKAALEAILEDANARIYAFLKQPIFVGSLSPGTHPPGSTAVLGILDGDKLTVANLGDSRLYLWRGGAMEQMTCDQDLRTDLLRAARDPKTVEGAALGALTQSVGSFFFDPDGEITSRRIKPDILALYLRAGDRLLICSDGVPDCLGEGHEAVMARELSDGTDVDKIAKRLCQLADEALGGDNITALVLLAH